MISFPVWTLLSGVSSSPTRCFSIFIFLCNYQMALHAYAGSTSTYPLGCSFASPSASASSHLLRRKPHPSCKLSKTFTAVRKQQQHLKVKSATEINAPSAPFTLTTICRNKHLSIWIRLNHELEHCTTLLERKIRFSSWCSPGRVWMIFTIPTIACSTALGEILHSVILLLLACNRNKYYGRPAGDLD